MRVFGKIKILAGISDYSFLHDLNPPNRQRNFQEKIRESSVDIDFKLRYLNENLETARYLDSLEPFTSSITIQTPGFEPEGNLLYRGRGVGKMDPSGREETVQVGLEVVNLMSGSAEESTYRSSSVAISGEASMDNQGGTFLQRYPGYPEKV